MAKTSKKKSRKVSTKSSSRSGKTSNVGGLAQTPTDPTTHGSVASWTSLLGPNQIGWLNYFFLLVCVTAQCTTFLISWPAWQVRPSIDSAIPNLPWIAGTPQVSMLFLLIASLGLVLLSPRKLGMAVHLSLLLIAISMDQIRCQPQVLCVTFLMAACVWPFAKRLCAWYLISMWTWAGIHKFLSPDWLGHVSCYMLVDVLTRLSSIGIELGITPSKFCKIFATAVALAEVATGVLAWQRPKSGAIACVLLHLGIACFLLLLGRNYSVTPWNLATAIVGAWVIWSQAKETAKATSDNPAGLKTTRRPLPRRVWGKAIVVAFLLLPIGFYFGYVRHCFAHVLYSNNLPLCVINRSDRIEFMKQDCWKDLKLPFPHSQKAFLDFFELTGQQTDTLHIFNRLPWLKRDQYFRHEGDSQFREISEREFIADQFERFHVAVVDDPRKIYQLQIAGARLKRRTKFDVVYAIEFNPETFEPQLLELLSGVPNVEQIQLRDCQISDQDLELIAPLRKLYGIGLSGTQVTDAGLKRLTKHDLLQIVEYEETAITENALRAFVESQTGTKIPD